MTALLPNDNQQNTEQTKVVCHYCKKPGHIIRDCRNRMKKEQEQRNDPSIQNTKTSISRSFAPSSQCQLTNHPPKNVGAVPMPLIDPNSSNRIIQLIIEIMGKKKET